MQLFLGGLHDFSASFSGVCQEKKRLPNSEDTGPHGFGHSHCVVSAAWKFLALRMMGVQLLAQDSKKKIWGFPKIGVLPSIYRWIFHKIK